MALINMRYLPSVTTTGSATFRLLVQPPDHLYLNVKIGHDSNRLSEWTL